MRAAAILTGPATHLDHLGVLSALLEIPLIVTEEKTLRQAEEFYPQITPRFHELSELSLDVLAEKWEVIFESGKFWAAELKPFFELLHRKTMRFVFCPHGNSDKGYSLRQHVEQDLSLVYGDHLYDHLHNTGALKTIEQVVYTGNYRLPFYREHKAFYDQLAEVHVFSYFREEKPVILYAPTWQDEENPTSFFSATEDVIEQLAGEYHLVIKLHPFLSEYHPAETMHLLQRYEGRASVLFVTDFPPIYPLLARSALYLGDFSSIGYDFLAFDRPLYFFHSAPKGSCLRRCGLEIGQKEQRSLKAFLKETREYSQHHFSKVRKEIYRYAFGEEKEPARLRQEIFNCLSGT